MSRKSYAPNAENFYGTSSSERLTPTTKGTSMSTASKTTTYISYEDRILEQLEILLKELPIPENTTRPEV